MQQIAIYLKGERDYAKIAGDTGPLVYPGAHVWIYKQLYRITDQGRDVQRAQYVFALVYLAALALALQCYRRARVRLRSTHEVSRVWANRGQIGSTVRAPAVDFVEADA
jgi:hypothetical protein